MTKTTAAIGGTLCLFLSAASWGHPVTMWQVSGRSNDVYLLGSIHLLRQEDHPLPSAIYKAYADSDKVVMELDMDDLDPVEGQALTNELGLLRDGRTLADLMGSDRYALARQLAEEVQIPIELLASSEPWLAAMTVEIALLTRVGFDPAMGIESSLLGLAVADAKEILGLETVRQQFEMLDGLSLESQSELLIQTLLEGREIRDKMDDMIEAWRIGDVGYMETNMLDEFAGYDELHRVIVVDRNLAWTDRIEILLRDDVDYLVVVGALHLVGEKGVPSLLQARGHEVIQMSEDRQ